MKLTHSLRTVAVCSAIALLGACSSKADRIESGLEKGAEYVRTADWDKANVEMRNVLQIDPKNAQAFYLAGQISEAKGEIQRAFGSYSKAVELKPEHIDAKVGLARLYLLAARLDDAEKSLSEVLAVDAKHAGALTMKAALTARRGDTAGAISQATALLATQKQPAVDTTMLLAGLHASKGDAGAALAVVEAALKAHPKNLGLLQVAAQITAGSADEAVRKRAVDFFRLATEAAPKNIDLWNAWAIHHTRLNQLDLAEAVLRDSVRSQPDETQRTLALLDFLSSRRGTEVAEKEFLAAIAAKPKEANLRFGLVSLYRNTNRAADARRVLQEIIDNDKDAPPALSARNQLAADLLSTGKVVQARALNEEVLKASPRDGAALVMRGRMLLAEGDARNAVIDLRAAARDQPGTPEITGLLAQAHRLAGEPQLAREVLADAVKFKPANPELRLLLAADMADAKEYKAAASEIDSALKAAPHNMRAYDMKAQLALAQKDRPGAEAVYSSLKTQFPKEPTGYIKLGQLYAEQKKYDAALKEYDAASQISPQAHTPTLSAIGVLLAQKKFDEASKRVEALAEKDPKSELPHRLRAEVAVARGNLPLAEESYVKLIAFAPTSAGGYVGLARVKAQRGSLPEALAALEQGEKANPAEAALPAMRAEWLTRAGRNNEAIELYEALLKRSPDDEASANNLAYLLAETKGDKPSLERALTLTRGFKGSLNPGYLDTLGWTHYKLGQYDDAVSVLERAVQRSPDGALYQLHLGMALHKKGDIARAQPHLKKALDSKAALPNLEEARKLLAQK
ncbi:MAG: PEP-CTERM system TPR-repeat protein PrsT [Rhizobacter sp.]